MPKMNLRHNFPLFLALLVVTVSIPLTVFVALNQIRLKSKASAVPSYPLTEFGTVISLLGPVGGGGASPSASITSPIIPSQCPLTDDGQVVCPILPPPDPDFCRSGTVVNQPNDHCGCEQPPVCQPPQPVTEYYLLTRGGRYYKLLQPYYAPCESLVCPKMPYQFIDFSQYLNRLVFLEGITSTVISWPYPNTAEVYVNSVKDAVLVNQNVSYNEVLDNATGNYVNENIYQLPFFSPPIYVRSSVVDLSPFVNRQVALNGDLYTVGLGDSTDTFLNVFTAVSDQHPVSWNTDYASFTANDFYIETNGQKFYGVPDQNTTMSIHSDPGSSTYTTLETIWQENGTEMRVFMYFNYTPNQFWKLYELRTYNGKTPGNWLYYEPVDQNGNLFQHSLGMAYINNAAPIILKSTNGAGILYMNNVAIQAFLNQSPPTPILSPTPTPTPIPNLCQYGIDWLVFGSPCPGTNDTYNMAAVACTDTTTTTYGLNECKPRSYILSEAIKFCINSPRCGLPPSPTPTPTPTPPSPSVAPVPQTDLYFLNANMELNTNSGFETKILASTYSNKVAAFEIHLSYNSSALQIDSLTLDPSSGISSILGQPTIDNINGKAAIVFGTPAGSQGFAGQGLPILIINGKTKSVSGQYQIILDPETKASQNGVNILRSTYPLNINIVQTYRGDIDKDGDVDIYDFGLLVQNFGRTRSQGFIPANIDPDIVKNDVVDIFDYSILVQDFGKGM